MADVENVFASSPKKKTGSKKNKKNWRKSTDITDVEEHLEEIRREERTGGILSEKRDEELFFLEKTAVEEKFEDVVMRNRSKDVQKEESSDEEEHVPRKVLLKRKREQEAEEEKQQALKITRASDDAWGKKDTNSATKNIWVESTFKEQAKKPKTVGEKPSSVSAVEVCEPGASYNPEFDHHQKLLQTALDREIKIIKDSEKLNKKVKFLSQEEYKKNPSWLDEMSEGLDDKNPIKEEKETEQNEGDETVMTKTTFAEDRKTRKQRSREKLRIEEEKARKSEKLNNVRLNDVYRLRSLKKELTSEQLKQNERKRQKEDIKKKKMNEPKRLGKLKYREPKVDFHLSEELSGTLRGLKPEGDLFLDRLRSYEKRNIIEPRKRVIPHRKYKLKEMDKRSYKKPTVKDFTSKL